MDEARATRAPGVLLPATGVGLLGLSAAYAHRVNPTLVVAMSDDADPVVACPCCTYAAPFGRFADADGCPGCDRSLEELREAAREVVEE